MNSLSLKDNKTLKNGNESGDSITVTTTMKKYFFQLFTSMYDLE